MPIWILCCCFPSDCQPGCSTSRVTPTCPSLFVCLSFKLSAVGPNHTTICPLPGSHPLRHGSSKCYYSVNLSRTSGTPVLWHTPVLSLRCEFEGNSAVREIPSLWVQKASERTSGQWPRLIWCRNILHITFIIILYFCYYDVYMF